nr:amidohydrolase family protein [Smaragdicoccus niigatensis]
MTGNRFHVRGVVLPGTEERDLWIHDGVISFEPIANADTLSDRGWIVPGLVDAHCHVGIKYGGGDETHEGAIKQAEMEREVGALLLRDAGSPIDTRFIDDHHELPKIIRAGRHIAFARRYIRDLGIELEDVSQLPDAVRYQARRGDGWVKIVGDWIDRGVGDLAPLWPDDILEKAIEAAHQEGARVTAHVFGEDALPGLINAGIDCIEHGTGLTDDTVAMMAAGGVALVPTLINIENFPDIASGASKFPKYQSHMLDLHKRVRQTVANAHDAGIAIYAGTDAGGGILHGRVADEVEALKGVGMTPDEALGAASWNARPWLGHPGIEPGAPADLLVYREDPRSGPGVLSAPDYVILRGRLVVSH